MQFKHLQIPLKEPLMPEELAALEAVGAQFPSDGFSIKVCSQSIDLSVREIDLFYLRALCEDVSKSFGLSNESNSLRRVVAAVDGIRSYAMNGKKRTFVDYNKERRVTNRKQKEQKRGQYFYAREHNFDRSNNALPPEYRNRIICGDSEEILRALPDNCIDLIVTSPPYNFGLEYEAGEDDHFWGDYFEKLFRIFDECIRVLKFGGRIAINVQPLYSDFIPSHHIISQHFIKRRLIWRAEILWEKHNYNCKYTAWGSWRSPSNPYVKYSWEFVEVFSKGALKKEHEQRESDLTAEEFKKWTFGYWAISPERRMKEFDHKAMFPEELVKRLVKLFSFKEDIVLDPFNGVGTTTFVAKAHERAYIGVDISQNYCDKAKERIGRRLI